MSRATGSASPCPAPAAGANGEPSAPPSRNASPPRKASRSSQPRSSRKPDAAATTSGLTISEAVDAINVAQALDIAWYAFEHAAGDDTAGWDTSSTSAEVRPEAPSLIVNPLSRRSASSSQAWSAWSSSVGPERWSTSGGRAVPGSRRSRRTARRAARAARLSPSHFQHVRRTNQNVTFRARHRVSDDPAGVVI